MAARNISFNGNNLQSSYIFVNGIDDASTPTRELSIYKLGHANASKIPYDQYSSKSITITGTIYGDDIVDLDNRIDTFKGYFNGIDKNLDIDYNGGTRRYIATMQSITVNRPGGLAFAEFSVALVCTLPFGRNATSTVLCNYTQRQLFTSNNNFSSNTTGWAGYNFGSITRSSAGGNYDGNTGFAVQVTTTGGSNQGITTSAIKTVTASTTYTFSAYVKAPVGVVITIQLDTYNGASAFQRSIANTIIGDGTWQRASVTATMTATEVGVNLVTYCAAATVYYMDAVLLESGNSPTTFFDSNLTAGLAQTFTFAGTAPLQQPIITVQIISGTMGSGTFTIGNDSNGQAVTINRTYALNDILLVDVPNKVIYVNGVEVDFVGAFPEFPPGSGTISCSITGITSVNMTYKIEYYPQYL